jgi:hypothetical protein
LGRFAQAHLRRSQVEAFAPLIVEHALRIGEQWQEGAVVDLAEELRRLTRDVMGTILFGRDWAPETPLRAPVEADADVFVRVVYPPPVASSAADRCPSSSTPSSARSARHWIAP